jgi:hypothetical protein
LDARPSPYSAAGDEATQDRKLTGSERADATPAAIAGPPVSAQRLADLLMDRFVGPTLAPRRRQRN